MKNREVWNVDQVIFNFVLRFLTNSLPNSGVRAESNFFSTFQSEGITKQAARNRQKYVRADIPGRVKFLGWSDNCNFENQKLFIILWSCNELSYEILGIIYSSFLYWNNDCYPKNRRMYSKKFTKSKTNSSGHSIQPISMIFFLDEKLSWLYMASLIVTLQNLASLELYSNAVFSTHYSYFGRSKIFYI